MLTLIDKVHLVSSERVRGALSEAVIDVHKGTVVSEQPVWVKLTNGVINAKRLEVSDGGEVIRFSGGVTHGRATGSRQLAGKRPMRRRLCFTH